MNGKDAQWLDCESEREIGEALGINRETVVDWTGGFSNALGNPPPASCQPFDCVAVLDWRTGEMTSPCPEAIPEPSLARESTMGSAHSDTDEEAPSERRRPQLGRGGDW